MCEWYCGNCINIISKDKWKLQNINRCCRGKICKICMNTLDLYYLYCIGNNMCFYCKAQSSRYLYQYYRAHKLDKAYKYKIRKYVKTYIDYKWYIGFDECREGDRPSNVDFYRDSGSIKSLAFMLNNEYIYRNCDRPSNISIYDNKRFSIQCLCWFINEHSIRKNNKPHYIYIYNNGNLNSLSIYNKQEYTILFINETNKLIRL